MWTIVTRERCCDRCLDVGVDGPLFWLLDPLGPAREERRLVVVVVALAEPLELLLVKEDSMVFTLASDCLLIR